MDGQQPRCKGWDDGEAQKGESWQHDLRAQWRQQHKRKPWRGLTARERLRVVRRKARFTVEAGGRSIMYGKWLSLTPGGHGSGWTGLRARVGWEREQFGVCKV